MTAFLKSLLSQSETKPIFKTKEECFQQGQAAYSQAYHRGDNPYPVGTDLREWWDSGWLDEQDELLGT